jgi:hypothetical protein
MEKAQILRLRQIRNAAALGLLGIQEYSECCSEIASMAAGKIDTPTRKAKPAKDRKERAGRDRSLDSDDDSEE